MKKVLVLLTLALCIVACEKSAPEVHQKDYERVMILVSAGYNNLSSYLRQDINDLEGSAAEGYIPLKGSRRALVLVSHLAPAKSGYKNPADVEIIQVSRDFVGNTICDTLHRIAGDNRLTETNVLSSALQMVVKDFDSESYGMVVSSHASGWLPAEYYSKSDVIIGLAADDDGWIDGIPVKSVLAETVAIGTKKHTFEMEISDFAASIPVHLDYLVFDACLMGGIEVAYELRQVTDLLAFSQAEVGAEGFCYELMAKRLLGGESPDVKAVCSDYFDKCNSASSEINRSATISLIDCRRLSGLSLVCETLFDKYRSALRFVDYKLVQGFFRFDKRYFFDLRDIFVQCGATAEELASLDKALEECVIYKASTAKVLGSFQVKSFCGLSMYLPSAGNIELDVFYRSLEWNKATSLVRFL